MKKLILIIFVPAILLSCGTRQANVAKPAEEIKSEAARVAQPASSAQPAEQNMWKISSYSGQLGDSKNAYYITNSYAIWGTYHKSNVDNTELKVKFMIDRVSFCIKLYEYGQKIVTKGDESSYKVTVKPGDGEPLQLTAKNVSDRIFISESDAKAIISLFEKGERITFSMTNDSKTNPATYAFSIDHPKGLVEVLGKLGK